MYTKCNFHRELYKIVRVVNSSVKKQLPREHESFTRFFSKNRGFQRQSLWSPIAMGEIPQPEKRIFGGELQHIPVGYFARGPFSQEKKGPAPFLMTACLCFPNGEIRKGGTPEEKSEVLIKSVGSAIGRPWVCTGFMDNGRAMHAPTDIGLQMVFYS